MGEGRVAASPRSHPIQAVLFDFDGLILDTETPILEVWQGVYRRYGQELRIEDWQHALGTHQGFDPFRQLMECTGQTIDRDALAVETHELHCAGCETQPLLPGVKDRLEEAKGAGLKTAVASSSSSAWVTRWLERHQLSHLLDTVVTRDDVAEVKPAPELFLLAASRLGVSPEACLVFEDSPNGIIAARAAGMRCIAVPNAVTRQLTLPDPDMVLGSLAECSLSDILTELSSPNPGITRDPSL